MSKDSYNAWEKVNGTDNLLYDFPLTSKSMVFDIGGCKGDWSFGIFQLYDPFIYAFEPVKAFYREMVKSLRYSPKVMICNKAISDSIGEAVFGVNGTSSGFYCENPDRTETVAVLDIASTISNFKIDLMKINVEGAEYKILDRILSVGAANQISNFLIQFHNIVPDHEMRRQNIHIGLSKTHNLVFDFPYVWEHWKING